MSRVCGWERMGRVRPCGVFLWGALQVDVHPEFRDTKCFFVKSRGAQDWVDFSYLKCLDARFGPFSGGRNRGPGAGTHDRRQRGQGQEGGAPGAFDRRGVGGGGRGYGRVGGGGQGGLSRGNGSALAGWQSGTVDAVADGRGFSSLPMGPDGRPDAAGAAGSGSSWSDGRRRGYGRGREEDESRWIGPQGSSVESASPQSFVRGPTQSVGLSLP